MEIDWFTLLAQIINFLILVGLLTYVLYRPIGRAMERREERIASRLQEAETKHQEAEEEAASYREARQQLENEREQLLTQAREAAEQRRAALLEEARREVDEVKTDWREAIRREQSEFLTDLRLRLGQELTQAVRNALADLADEDLEARMVSVFVRSLQDLDEDQRTTLREAVRQSDGAVVIQSAFPITSDQRRELTEALQDQLGDQIDVRCEVSEDVVAGIECQTGGRKLAWSLQSHLDDLEERIITWLRDETEAIDADGSAGSTHDRAPETEPREAP